MSGRLNLTVSIKAKEIKDDYVTLAIKVKPSVRAGFNKLCKISGLNQAEFITDIVERNSNIGRDYGNGTINEVGSGEDS